VVEVAVSVGRSSVGARVEEAVAGIEVVNQKEVALETETARVMLQGTM
jgi:FKBP-type peptidyl-prolyl cis-trans isomerase 2